MKKLIVFALLLIALVTSGDASIQLSWDFHRYSRDVLEVWEPSTSQWRDVEGPYRLSDNFKEYRVSYEGTLSHALFRVRREFGLPWISERDLARTVTGRRQPQPRR